MVRGEADEVRTYYLADHRAGECLWPMAECTPPNGDMSRQVFCCAAVEGPRSRYCAVHNAMAFRRASK